MSLTIYLKENYCEKCQRSDEVYQCNITHNLNTMADNLGIYGILWYPDDNDIVKAKQLIKSLGKAIKEMKKKPKFYKQFESPNGWGKYDHFLIFLSGLLTACKKHPEAKIEVSR